MNLIDAMSGAFDLLTQIFGKADPDLRAINKQLRELVIGASKI